MPLPDPALARPRLIGMTLLALAAFAGNSLLCRAALDRTGIDPASFTAIRLVAGALMLLALLRWRRQRSAATGSWPSALALFAYAAAFSFAYTGMSAGTGALILFGSVQATMLAVAWWRGTRWTPIQWAGLVFALLGLIVLLFPGLHAPGPLPGALMLLAGLAWGVYSLRGRTGGDPTAATAGNFLRAVPMGLLACALALPWLEVDAAGAALAVMSGAVTSGLGYAVWYRVLPHLSAQVAGSCQLGVPVITAVAGVALLGEAVTLRLLLGSLAVLGGIALTLGWRRKRDA